MGPKVQKGYQSPYRALKMPIIGPTYMAASDELSCIFNMTALPLCRKLDKSNLRINVPVGMGFTSVKLDLRNFFLSIDYMVRAYFVSGQKTFTVDRSYFNYLDF